MYSSSWRFHVLLDIFHLSVSILMFLQRHLIICFFWLNPKIAGETVTFECLRIRAEENIWQRKYNILPFFEKEETSPF